MQKIYRITVTLTEHVMAENEQDALAAAEENIRESIFNMGDKADNVAIKHLTKKEIFDEGWDPEDFIDDPNEIEYAPED